MIYVKNLQEVENILAEIHNKISRDGRNISELSEDQLTGNFFGCLRYLPFDMGIKRILTECVNSKDITDIIDNIHLEQWAGCIKFWNDCSWKRTEPDVVIKLEDTVILIEVKLNSSESETQIEREMDLLTENPAYKDCTNKILLVLAREDTADDIYKKNKEICKSIDNIFFGYLSWQEILTTLKKMTERNAVNSYQNLILKDLRDLLIHKGFERFKDFTSNINSDIKIRKDLYYEFK